MERPADQNINLLSPNLMELVCARDNMNRAYKHVMKNKGVPGIDHVGHKNFNKYLKKHKQKLLSSLLAGTYKPKVVLGVYLPKPKKEGFRCIGILSYVDRLVQQAIYQIINDPIDQIFSKFSFGFRKGRHCMDAIKQAQEYILDGCVYVADIDIEKFFDNIHHDQVMYRLSKLVADKRILRLIRRFLKVGLWIHGNFENKRKGIYQGGALSPLLSNLLLHEIDELLERRGHKFCRYADDIKIYTKSLKAAARSLASIETYMQRHLKLQCNKTKTKACRVNDSEFLGCVIDDQGRIRATQNNFRLFKYKIKNLTRRRSLRNIDNIIKELNWIIVGWTSYFRFDYRAEEFQYLDTYLRRRFRALLIKRALMLRENGMNWLRSLGINNLNLDFSRMTWRYRFIIKDANFLIQKKWFQEHHLRMISESIDKYKTNYNAKVDAQTRCLSLLRPNRATHNRSVIF